MFCFQLRCILSRERKKGYRESGLAQYNQGMKRRTRCS